jgi:hypothetical protein
VRTATPESAPRKMKADWPEANVIDMALLFLAVDVAVLVPVCVEFVPDPIAVLKTHKGIVKEKKGLPTHEVAVLVVTVLGGVPAGLTEN